MQKVTRTAALLLVALAGLLLVVAIAMGLRKPETVVPVATPPSQRGEVAAVVAARDLPAGVPITTGDLRIAPLASLPAGGYISAVPLIGKVPTVAIASGTPLTSAQLAEGLALNLQPGERALAVPVDELAGVGNRIAPGDYVDVFLSLKDKARGLPQEEGDESQSRLLLSHLRVLGYGTRDIDFAPPPADTRAEAAPAPAGGRAGGITSRGGNTANGRDPAVQPRSAVLAVPVEEANRLLLGAQSGKLFLALRHPADPGRPDESLFPRPRNVLTPRPDLGPGLRDTAATPENAAFAGIDGAALAGHNAAPSAGTRASATQSRGNRRPAAPAFEIIRGGQAGTLSSP